jgi:hypothetical protein
MPRRSRSGAPSSDGVTKALASGSQPKSSPFAGSRRSTQTSTTLVGETEAGHSSLTVPERWSMRLMAGAALASRFPLESL